MRWVLCGGAGAGPGRGLVRDGEAHGFASDDAVTCEWRLADNGSGVGR